MADLGRQVKFGIGKETTAGTPVAASNWVNQLKFDLAPVADYITNESSFGVLEKTNSADVAQLYAKGSLEAKLTDKTGGYFLLGAFGSVSTAANADGSGTVKDHTFTMSQNINGQSFTLIRKDSVATEAYALTRFDTWELNIALDDYIKFNTSVMALAGASTSATPAYVVENEFLAKNFAIRTAANLAGLGAASDIATVESLTITTNPNLDVDRGMGSVAPYGFSSRGYEIKFEMTKRYTDNTYRDAHKNGTPLAARFTMSNGAVTIGTAAHPGLVITTPLFNVTDWSLDGDLDKPVTETLTGTIHYSPTDAYSMKAVLTNTQTSY